MPAETIVARVRSDNRSSQNVALKAGHNAMPRWTARGRWPRLGLHEPRDPVTPSALRGHAEGWCRRPTGGGTGHLRDGRSHYPDAATHAQRAEIPVVGRLASRTAPGHMTTATLVVSGPRPSWR